MMTRIGQAMLMAALALLLTGCCGTFQVQVVGTPTAAPATGVPAVEPTRVPATEATVAVPTNTAAITGEATPSPLTMSTPTVVSRVNLREISNRLWHLTSFAFDLHLQTTGLHFSGEWINTPQGWHIRKIESGGAVPAEYTAIGDREWAVLAESQLPIPCTGWQQRPEGSLAYHACEIGVAARSVVETSLGYVFQEGEAQLVPGITEVDDIPCYEYNWRDSDGNVLRMHVAAESGLPVMFEGSGLTLHFNRFNDPRNTIVPPTSEMPERLHIDDARMALNGLSSFQYVTTGEITGEGGNTITYYVEGVYVQTEQTWHADWRWNAEDDQPAVEFVSINDNTWLKSADMTMWFPVSWDEGTKLMARDAAPFANWPSLPHSRIGTRQPGQVRTVAGTECQDYLFVASVTRDEGYEYNMDYQVRLCVTIDGGIPVRMELSASAENVRMFITRELSHLDDPANMVELPEEYISQE